GIIALTVSASVYGQTWSGSTLATGNAYRSGSVGIGTVTSPTAYLHIQSPSGYQFKLERSNSGHNNALGIFITSGTGINAGSVFFQCDNPLGTSDMVFKPTPSVTGMLIRANGKVLIGDPGTINTTTTTDYKLYVQTGILTERVKVAISTTSNWSDFVFDKNYKLLSLPEVESYIKANKHLPGIPSAEEVVANGVDLAEMDARLLQKIEELTLHIISLEKEINNLKEKK
ncbi:MAG: TMF family protein, partial [Bacteroidota bacterium]